MTFFYIIEYIRMLYVKFSPYITQQRVIFVILKKKLGQVSYERLERFIVIFL